MLTSPPSVQVLSSNLSSVTGNKTGVFPAGSLAFGGEARLLNMQRASTGRCFSLSSISREPKEKNVIYFKFYVNFALNICMNLIPFLPPPPQKC